MVRVVASLFFLLHFILPAAAAQPASENGNGLMPQIPQTTSRPAPLPSGQGPAPGAAAVMNAASPLYMPGPATAF
jgi:hypothetical protein